MDEAEKIELLWELYFSDEVTIYEHNIIQAALSNEIEIDSGPVDFVIEAYTRRNKNQCN